MNPLFIVSPRTGICRSCRYRLHAPSASPLRRRPPTPVFLERLTAAPRVSRDSFTTSIITRKGARGSQSILTSSGSARYFLSPLPKPSSVPSPKRPSRAEALSRGDRHDPRLSSIRAQIDSVLASERIPSEQEVLDTLSACQDLGDIVVFENTAPDLRTRKQPKPTLPPSAPTVSSSETPSSALLSLDESRPQPTTATPSPSAPPSDQLLDHPILTSISHCVLTLLSHPPIFISPPVLAASTDLLLSISRPSPLPEIFHLYAHKPLPSQPKPNSPVAYTTPAPSKISNAIPSPLSSRALTAALTPPTKDLPLALSIIDQTSATAAFRRDKFFRKALLPLTAAALAPLAAYTLATRLAFYQNTMDPSNFSTIAFVGILAYLGFTSVIGIVALTTANDQMDRVTWATGMPLRERWLREEERAAVDRVAGAWGFREKGRRGEEEGEEWDALRRSVGLRGMVLDRVELMEGME